MFTDCTEIMCMQAGNAYCNDENENLSVQIPEGCATWYDGCNTCSVQEGKLSICTLMMCFKNGEPSCLSYYIREKLHVGDICSRFCEDSSQSFIDRKNECPLRTRCASTNTNIGFDTCGDNALRCITIGH